MTLKSYHKKMTAQCGYVAAIVLACLLVLVTPSVAQSAGNTTNSTTNSTLPFFSLRVSGSYWQAALNSSYSNVTMVVKSTLSDALGVPEADIVVVSLTVGSLVVVFLVESTSLTATQVVRAVTVASLSSLEDLYQRAAQTNETLTILSASAEAQDASSCDDTCIAVAVVASVVGVVLVGLLVWWTFRALCRDANGNDAASATKHSTSGTRGDGSDHQPLHGSDQREHPIQHFEEQLEVEHEQPLPVHALDYPREHNTYGGGGYGGAREMRDYNPHTTYTISPQPSAGFRLDRATAPVDQQQQAYMYEQYETPNRRLQ